MRIQMTTSGGLAFFPALAGPVAVDTSTLPQAAVRRLEELVAAAQFFTRPPPQQGTPGGADTQLHVLTIEDHGVDRTLEFREPISDASINDLISFVRSVARHSSGAGPAQ